MGEILEYHRFGGIVKFVDSVARYKKIIILFDRDKKGRHLTRKAMELLQRRTRVELSYKRKLQAITRRKIKCTEELACYEPFMI